jgi:hypothetical protein
MDLAKIAELLGSKTEGDPGFQDTEESQFFVHLLRMDDVDNRAAAIRQPIDPIEQPEASDQQVQEIKESADLLTSSGDDTVAEPAATESANVAPEAEPSQALFSEGPTASPSPQEIEEGPEAQPVLSDATAVDDAQPAEMFLDAETDGQPAEITSESGPDAEAADLFREDGPDAEGIVQQRDDGQDAAPAVQEREESPEAQAPEILRDAGPDAEAAVPQRSDGEDAAPPQVFQQEGPEAQSSAQAPPDEFLEISTPSPRGETTLVVPETLMEAGFMNVLRLFDTTVRVPDIQIGETPPVIPVEGVDPADVRSSTEGAEMMLTGLSRNMVELERRR